MKIINNKITLNIMMVSLLSISAYGATRVDMGNHTIKGLADINITDEDAPNTAVNVKMMKMYIKNSTNNIDPFKYAEDWTSIDYRYKTVRIGNGKRWTVENLYNYRYSDGTSIPEWKSGTMGQKDQLYRIDNSLSEDQSRALTHSYGYFYGYDVLNSTHKICGKGFHLPTDDDWKTLEKEIELSTAESNKEGERGVNIGFILMFSKFSSKLTGRWISPDNSHQDLGKIAHYGVANSNLTRTLHSNKGSIQRSDGSALPTSIRCVED
jgi:uncharacterized protein (TIGR02145 family)